MQVLAVGKHEPTAPPAKIRTFCFGKPRSLMDATVIDYFNPNSWITQEQIQWELGISSRQLLRYRELATLVENYKLVARKRNPNYKPRTRGSTLPRIDQPPFTYYEVWVIGKVRRLLNTLKTTKTVVEYIKNNPEQFTALTYAKENNLQLENQDDFS